MSKEQFTVTIINDDEEEVVLHPPGKWEVCPRCRGEGQHCNPNIDGNGITSSEMAELGPDFLSDYMGGVYDVTCHECDGKRVVWEIDWEKWEARDPINCKAYEDWLRSEAEYYATLEAERRMGA